MPKKILFYGDSNTYGYDPAGFPLMRYPEKVCWTTRVAEGLGDAWQVLPEGMNGRSLPDLSWEGRRIRGLAERAQLDGIFAVMLGTNDLLMAMRPDPEKAVRRMEALLSFLTGIPAPEEAAAEGSRSLLPADRILVIAPAHIAMEEMKDPLYHLYYDASVRMNEGFRELSGRFGTHFADAGSWKIPLAADLVHFSAEGHKVFAEGMLSYLENEFGLSSAPGPGT